MIVTINNMPINFKLEEEKTITDIIDSISDWVKERDLIFTEFYIDGEMYLIDKTPDIEINEIELLNCIVESKADVVFSTIDEVTRYCDKIAEYITQSMEKNSIDESQLENLSDGIEWILEVLIKVLGLIGLNVEEVKYLDKGLSSYVSEIKEFKNELINNKDELLSLFKDKIDIFFTIKDIFKLLMASNEMKKMIIKSIDSPDIIISSIVSIRNELNDQLNNIEETAIAFQTGKDSDGAEKLNKFIDFIYRYTRTCCQAVPVFGIDLSDIEIDGLSLEEKNRNLQDQLNETIEIMESNDIISLSDILEYEIKPSLENLDSYLEELSNIIKGN